MISQIHVEPSYFPSHDQLPDLRLTSVLGPNKDHRGGWGPDHITPPVWVSSRRSVEVFSYKFDCRKQLRVAWPGSSWSRCVYTNRPGLGSRLISPSHKLVSIGSYWELLGALILELVIGCCYQTQGKAECWHTRCFVPDASYKVSGSIR